MILGVDRGSDTCRFQSISICRSRSGALKCSRVRAGGEVGRARRKAAIIAESYGAGETVCAVARRHGLTPQQLFAWRRLARRSASVLPTVFVPAVVERVQPEPRAPMPPRRARRRSKADGIELEIAGVEVRVGADAKPRAIEAVIRALKAHS